MEEKDATDFPCMKTYIIHLEPKPPIEWDIYLEGCKFVFRL
jgi:hypothetical protein